MKATHVTLRRFHAPSSLPSRIEKPSERLQIAQRLEAFLKSIYGESRGWKSHAARDLGMGLQELRQYLPPKPKSSPGNILQQRLRNALSCNIDWLMGRRGTFVIDPNHLAGKRSASIYVEAKILFDRYGKQKSEELFEDCIVPFFVGNYFGLYVTVDMWIDAAIEGHSLQIRPGDVAVFEKNRVPKAGDIITVTLKRTPVHERIIGVFRPRDAMSFSLNPANRYRVFETKMIKESEIEEDSKAVLVATLSIAPDEKKRYGLVAT